MKCTACSIKNKPVYVKPIVEKDENGKYLVCPKCGSNELIKRRDDKKEVRK